MDEQWTLTEASKKAWKREIKRLMGDHTQASLAKAMGLPDSADDAVSRFFSGTPEVLKRWLSTRKAKYGERLASVLGVQLADLLVLLQRVASTPEATHNPGDWHPAFPGVRVEQVLIEPPMYGHKLEAMREQNQRGRTIRVRGRGGSGRTTLAEHLRRQGIEVQEEDGDHRILRDPSLVFTVPWGPAQVQALGRRLIEQGIVQDTAAQRLEAFLGRLVSEPALALVERPGEVIVLLSQVAEVGTPDPLAMREELMRAEWRRVEEGPEGDWVKALGEAGLTRLLADGLLAGALDEAAWQSVIEAGLPRAVSLRRVVDALERLPELKGETLREAVDGLRISLVGWSAGEVTGRLIRLGFLVASETWLFLPPNRLLACRLARHLITASPGWLARIADEAMARLVVAEAALAGWSWKALQGELDRLASERWQTACATTIAFAAHTPAPQAIPIEAPLLDRWAGALWLALTGVLANANFLIGWHPSEAIRSLDEGRWPAGAELVALSNRLAGRLPRLAGPDFLGTLAGMVPPAILALAERWLGGVFSPPAGELSDEREETPADIWSTSWDARAAFNVLLVRLAPAQCLPDLRERRLPRWWRYRWEAVEQSWRLAAQAGDAFAMRLLAYLKRQPGDALRWVGLAEPTEKDLERALFELRLFHEKPTPTETVVDVLRRFPPEWVAEELQRRAPPYGPDLLALAVALLNRPLLDMFAEPEPRFDKDQCWQSWRRRSDQNALWLGEIDSVEETFDRLWGEALKARTALYDGGVVEPLRAWGDEVTLPDFEAKVRNQGLVWRGTYLLLMARDWASLSALLPEEEVAEQVLDHVVPVGRILNLPTSGSPLHDSVDAITQARKLGGFIEVVRWHLAKELRPSDLKMRFEFERLRALADLPPEADGPRPVLAVLLLLWRDLHIFYHRPLLQWQAYLAHQEKAQEAPQDVMWAFRERAKAFQSKAVAALIERRDEPTLRRYIEVASSAEEPWRGKDPLYDAVKERLEQDSTLRERLLALKPPATVVERITPRPARDAPKPDSEFMAALNTPEELYWFARWNQKDPRCRPLCRKLAWQAAQHDHLDAQIYWSLWAGDPIDDLIAQWLERPDLFEGPAEFVAGQEDQVIRAGWGYLVHHLGERGEQAALWSLLPHAPLTDPTEAEDRYERWGYPLDLPGERSFDHGPPARRVAKALAKCAPPAALLTLGHQRLIDLGLYGFWAEHAPIEEVFAALEAMADRVPDFFEWSGLEERLLREDHEPFFQWLEGRVRNPPELSWDYVGFPYANRRGALLDRLLEHRPARALAILDDLFSSAPPPMELVHGLAFWQDDPQIALRLHRWLRAGLSQA